MLTGAGNSHRRVAAGPTTVTSEAKCRQLLGPEENSALANKDTNTLRWRKEQQQYIFSQ